ncbi:MAG: AMP-binding protein [Proteobacteria bacterium]|nr:AMP-binding protein [Pseudomonadota bacterium]MDA0993733.1 AMP-binding protein [Pseudomonadota bacterium]
MQTFIDPLIRASQVAGIRTAVISGDRRFTHGELLSRCRRLAAVLKNKGAEPGDRIAILAANTNHYIESYVAIPAAGFVVVPLNTRHAEPELRYAIEDAGAKILLTDRDPGSLGRL